MEKLKILIITFGGIVTAHFKAYLPLLAVVSAAVIFDIVTGVIAAVYTGTGLNSKKARLGALKKAAMFMALGFGIFLDYLIPLAAARLSVTIPQTVVFSSVIAFYIAFGECISVCENLYKCNPDAFPKWIAAILSDSKNAIDKGENKWQTYPYQKNTPSPQRTVKRAVIGKTAISVSTL